GGQSGFFGIFDSRPVGMARLTVHIRHARVDSMEVGQLLNGFVIEKKCAPVLAPLNAGIGNERGYVWRRGVRLLQAVEATSGQPLKAHAEAVPESRVIGSRVAQFAKLGGGLFEPACSHQGIGQHPADFLVLRLRLENSFEMWNGVAVMPRHALSEGE